jgi:hypothetical protein
MEDIVEILARARCDFLKQNWDKHTHHDTLYAGARFEIEALRQAGFEIVRIV